MTSVASSSTVSRVDRPARPPCFLKTTRCSWYATAGAFRHSLSMGNESFRHQKKALSCINEATTLVVSVAMMQVRKMLVTVRQRCVLMLVPMRCWSFVA